MPHILRSLKSLFALSCMPALAHAASIESRWDQLLDNLPPHVELLVRVGIILLLAAVAIYAIGRLANRVRHILLSGQRGDENNRRAVTLVRVLRYVLTLVVAVIAGISILSQMGIQIGPILGAAGVVGIAIGFGAQSLVKDYFTGFFLLLENQIRIGDSVEVAGKTGIVEVLTLRYLRLRDYRGHVHYIPNGQITVVTNCSLGHVYAVIDVGVAYDTDIAQATSLIDEAATNLRTDPLFAGSILGDIEIAGVDALADSAITLRARIRVRPLADAPVRRALLLRIKEAFARAGIDIPYPHRTLIHVNRNT